MRKKPTTIFVYLLGSYVLLQFIWWGFHLIELTTSSNYSNEVIRKRVIMIIGEGSVFLTLLLFGLWKIKATIKKEVAIARQQNNFMLSVTHELKTPIAASKLYAQTLLKHQLSEEKRTELLNKTIDESNRLESLVEQLLTAARLEQSHLEINRQTFELQDVFSEIISLHEKRERLGIQLKNTSSLTITSDRFLLITILKNLTENAAKYGFSEKGIVLNYSCANGILSITVQDFGLGIPIEEHGMIFKKFVRLENEETRTKKGTGLGLFIAFECTKALGGNLKLITNKSSVGALFEITIPYE
jgi:K+-sensing histidine kinase KdpD